jgi:hypothetical protein
MRELIRHILKENNLKQELKKVIDDDNIFKAADLVGGMDNLKSIFKDEPEMSSLFEKLTGTVTFYYIGYLEFPLEYEIIGRRSNVHNTNHWAEINVLYDENKLTPEENEVFKDMIKYLVDEAQHSGMENKFNDGRIFNTNYLTVTEVNGQDINSIDYGYDFSNEDFDVKNIHDKLYGDSESLNESNNRETDKNLRVINILLSQISWEGLCDIWVEYNLVDKDYEIRSKSIKRHFDHDEIVNELNFVEESIKAMGLRPYVFSPWHVDNCEDEVKFMNESINKSDEKRNKIIEKIMDDIIFPEYNHIICGYDVKNDEVFNEPVVNVTFIGGYGTKLWPVTQGIQRMYNDILNEIWNTIYDYINIPVGVTMETTPKCDEQENIYLRESENKSEDKKLKLVKEMIYSLFDEVEFIEVDTNYEGKPLIKIYHDVEDTAANYDNWFSHRIQDEIKEMTGDGIILSPWWALGWDWKYKNVDFYINVQKIEYDDEGNVINESEENKKEKKFNRLIQKVEDYLNSNEYPSVKKFTVYYEDTHDDVIVNIFFDAEVAVKLGGGINSVIKRVGKQVMEDLEVFPMDFKYYIHFDRDINESEEKKPKYLNIIKDLVEPFEDEDCVCDIRVLYDEEDDMYLIDLNMGTEELNEKFFAVVGMTHYVKTLRVKIKETIKDYLPIDNFYVGSYASPNCKWKPLNESSIKERSLVKLIEKDGLYDFIVMAGLDFNQVRSLLKNIDNSKEILKQYIREFVIEHDGMSGENHGSLFALRLPLSNTKYVNDIMVQDRDQIAVEIIEYHIDEYGHREDKDQYLTSINNLTDEELLSILSWMMETVKGGYWF